MRRWGRPATLPQSLLHRPEGRRSNVARACTPPPPRHPPTEKPTHDSATTINLPLTGEVARQRRRGSHQQHKTGHPAHATGNYPSVGSADSPPHKGSGKTTREARPLPHSGASLLGQHATWSARSCPCGAGTRPCPDGQPDASHRRSHPHSHRQHRSGPATGCHPHAGYDHPHP